MEDLEISAISQDTLPADVSTLNEFLTSTPLSQCDSEMQQSPLAPNFSPLLSQSSATLSSVDTQIALVTTPLMCQAQLEAATVFFPDDVPFSASAGEGMAWCGFKIVGDNIDKTVHHRYQRVDSETGSLHYFNAYAVRDRLDLSHLSDLPKKLPDSIPLEALLPSEVDLCELNDNFGILLLRMLVRYLPVFKPFQDFVLDHIPHAHSSEMSQRSQTVGSNIYVYYYYH